MEELRPHTLGLTLLSLVLVTTACGSIKDKLPKPMPAAFENSGLVAPDRDTSVVPEPQSPIAGSKILVPPGALDADVRVTLSEGESLVNEYNGTILNAEGLIAAGPPINIWLEPEATPTAALFLTVPLFKKFDKEKRLSVVYKVKKEDAEVAIGHFPDSSIGKQEKTVLLSIGHPGTFQAVYVTNGSIKAEGDISILDSLATPVLPKNQIAFRGQWSSVHAEASDHSTAIFGGALSDSAPLADCVVIIDRDRKAPWDHRFRTMGNPKYEFVASKDGGYFGQFQCLDREGVVSPLSGWSNLVDLQPSLSETPDEEEDEEEPGPDPAEMPKVIAITRFNPSDTVYVNASKSYAVFLVQFSEPVNNVAETDFNFEKLDGDVGGMIAMVSEYNSDPSQYIVQVASFTNDGKFTIAFADPDETVTDMDGHPTFHNESMTSEAFVRDTIAPTLTINTLAAIDSSNETSYSISGTCSENGRIVNWVITEDPTSENLKIGKATCTDGVWNASDIDVSGLIEGSIKVTAGTDDEAGNTAPFIFGITDKDLSES